MVAGGLAAASCDIFALSVNAEDYFKSQGRPAARHPSTLTQLPATTAATHSRARLEFPMRLHGATPYKTSLIFPKLYLILSIYCISQFISTMREMRVKIDSFYKRHFLKYFYLSFFTHIS